MLQYFVNMAFVFPIRVLNQPQTEIKMLNLGGISILLSFFFTLTVVNCKKKPIDRPIASPTDPFDDPAEIDDCEFPLSLTKKTKVDPKKLAVENIQFIPSQGSHSVVVTEPISAPPADIIAYEVCYQDQGNKCKTYYHETNYEPRNSELVAGMAKVTAWACCNETDDQCEGTSIIEKSFGVLGAERNYYCGPEKAKPEYIKIEPKIQGLQLTSGSNKHQESLETLDNGLEWAAREAWKVINSIVKSSKQPEKEYPAYVQLINNGFELFLIEIRSEGLEYAKSIIHHQNSDAKKKPTGLNLANSNQDCLDVDSTNPFDFDPPENPYSDLDPEQYTSSPTTLETKAENDNENDEKPKENGKRSEEEKLQELRELCEYRARQYAELECGDISWTGANECMVYPKASDPYPINPLVEPEFTSCVVVASPSGSSGRSAAWKVAGGFSYAIGAVALTAGVAASGYEHHKSKKLNASIQELNSKYLYSGLIDTAGNFNEYMLDENENLRKEYSRDIGLANDFEVRKSLTDLESVIDNFEDAKFSKPNKEIEELVMLGRKKELLKQELENYTKSGEDPERTKVVNDEYQELVKSYEEGIAKLDNDTDIEKEYARQKFFVENDLDTRITTGTARTFLERRKIVLQHLNDLMTSNNPDRFQKAQEMYDNLKAGGVVAFGDSKLKLRQPELDTLFAGKSPVVRSSAILGASNPTEFGKIKNKRIQDAIKAYNDLAPDVRAKKNRRTLIGGAVAIAFGYITFALAEDPRKKRLADLENYMVENLLKSQALKQKIYKNK